MQGKYDEKVGYDTPTFFGGFMTILMILSMMGYLIFRINTLYDERPYTYQRTDVPYGELGPILNTTMGQYNDSFNVIFAFNDGFGEDFDALNNPYFEFILGRL